MAIYTVTTLVDENDGGPGGAGLSLRDALTLANGTAGADTINFAAGLAGGTLFLSQDLQLSITTNLTINGDINGDGTPDITIDADSGVGLNDAPSRVFLVDGAGAGTISATLNGLVIQDGNAGGIQSGGGIFVGRADALTLTNATVSGNTAVFLGGGIYGANSAAVTLINATVSGNSAYSNGGGIVGVDGAAITLTNATVSGNTAVFLGGGIYVDNAAITLTNSTVSGNIAPGGGGIFIGGISVITLTNSIVAGNDGVITADDLYSLGISDLVFTGGNIIGSAPVSFATTTGPAPTTIDGTDQAALETVFADVANDPNTGVLSGVLADNGGAVQTVAIATGGIARDAGDDGELPSDTHDLDGDGNTSETLPFDARGGQRVIGASVDLGAFEAGQFIVTTLEDEDAAAVPDFATELADGDGLSLREALALANDDPGTADTITFALGLAGGTLFLTSGEQLSITDGVSIDGDIDGDGTADITIDADSDAGLNDAASRVFLIDGPGTVAATLNGLVIQDGRAAGLGPGGLGGGILVGTADALTLTNSIVADNSASFHGGGVAGYDGAAITLVNSLVFDNSAGVNGGGVIGLTGAAVTLVNSTVAGNYAGGHGGGVFGFNADVTLSNTTVFGNYADDNGGGIGGSGEFVLTNATVSGNGAGNDGGGIWGLGAEITLSSSTVSGNYAGDDGGGIYNGQYFATVRATTLTNSIVAGNDAGDAGDDLGGGGTPLVFTGSNIIGSAPANFAPVTGAPTQTIDGTDQTALETVFRRVDFDFFTGVLSGVLADNGGLVPTIAIARGGIAHDTGVNANLPADPQDLDGDTVTGETLPVDARGFDRTVGTVDIGAFEQQLAAPPFVVTTLQDGGDDDFDGGDLAAEEGDGDGLSLREALGLANDDPTSPDTITFAPGLTGGTLTLQSGELGVEGDVTIDGDINGDGTFDITVSGNAAPGNQSAVFHFYSGTSTLNGVRVTGGSAYYGAGVSVGAFASYGYADVTISNAQIDDNTALYGGGISVDTGSSLRLVNSTVRNNHGDIGGGIAVNEDATLTVINSTISDNHADIVVGLYLYGGGIAVNAGAHATLINSTVSGNSAYSGGGIYNGGFLTLINTTLANNVAEYGGGLYNTVPICGCGGEASLINSTVTGNYAFGIGGGIYHDAGTLHLANTIVAGNLAGYADPDVFLGDVTTYAGRNAFSQPGVGRAGIDFFRSNLNLADIFASVVQVDLDGAGGIPLFPAGELANNGGPVRTVALNRSATNPALDSGDATQLAEATIGLDLNGDGDTDDTIATDARGLGFARPVGPGVDLGAFEVQNNAPVITSNGGGANAVVVPPENTTAVTTVTATDLQNDVLAFSIVGGADAARFQINAATGVLSFITAPDFESPTDAGRNNGYEVRVRASDGALFDDQAITVNVTDETGFRLVDSGDINGDGRDDLLWREESGELLVWYANGSQVEAVSLGILDTVWSVVGLGDFNGDGSSEIVRRHANGELVVDGVSRGILDNVWSIEAIGDFSGDGRDEFVYRRSDNGELTVDGVSRGRLDHVWTIVGDGDFNGDGRDELVYRRSDNGELVVDGVSRGLLDNVWSIAGVGNVNGDGRDELVYRHVNGEVLIDGRSIGVADNNWRIEALPDFDANGTSDLLWRNINGNVELNGRLLGHLDII